MAWKDLADKLAKDLKKKNEECSNLEFQLAECQEQIKNATPSHAYAHNGPVQQVINLQHKLESERTEKDQLARDNASLNETLQNTLAKSDKANKQAHDENQALHRQLAEEKEARCRLQATQTHNQGIPGREKDLEDQVAQLTADLESARTENSALKTINGSLSKQLQVEKAENTKYLAFMRSDPSKGYDQDDEEPLPTENAVMKEQSKAQSKIAFAEPAKKFKTSKVLEEFKSKVEASMPQKSAGVATKKAEKTPAARKRKRSAQEEIDEDLAELNIEDFKMPTQPRRKRRAVFEGSYEEGMSTEFVRDGTPPGNAVANSRTKSAVAKKGPAESFMSMVPTPNVLEPTPSFTFTAVRTYKEDGTPSNDARHSTVMEGMDGLWNRINAIITSWEEHKGEDWQWTFLQRGYNPKKPDCVTQKVQGKRTKWHQGFEGLYACRDCVGAGRPCFTYVPEVARDEGWVYSDYWLLPLAEEDRKKAVTKGREVRWWVNDGVGMVKPDSGDEDMGWD